MLAEIKSIGMPKLGPLDITNGRGLAEPGKKASTLRAASNGCAQGTHPFEGE
ncbi:hypothetical protein [Nitrobacter winogradskyi]|uniref:hypothetical protein n=1 Tax=Nitrobacter winogradskyi TaxID=913 RepID=UPI00164FC197|nr:hypothetical protein [Nitrobacter winogradskyi]